MQTSTSDKESGILHFSDLFFKEKSQPCGKNGYRMKLLPVVVVLFTVVITVILPSHGNLAAEELDEPGEAVEATPLNEVRIVHNDAADEYLNGDELRQINCPPGTFICPFYGNCCKKNSAWCSNRSVSCQDVFKENEDKDKTCCNILDKENVTTDVLLEICRYRLGSEKWQDYCKAEELDEPGEAVEATPLNEVRIVHNDAADEYLNGDELRQINCPPGTFICPFYGNCCKKNSAWCSNRSVSCQDVFKENEDKDKTCCNILDKENVTTDVLLEICRYRLGSEKWQDYCKAEELDEPGEAVEATPLNEVRIVHNDAADEYLNGDELRQINCPPGTFICPFYGNCCKKNSAWCSNRSVSCQDVFKENEDKDKTCCNILDKENVTTDVLLEICRYRLGSEKWQDYCKANYSKELQVTSTTADSTTQTTLNSDSTTQTTPNSKPIDQDCVCQGEDSTMNSELYLKIAVTILLIIIVLALLGWYCRPMLLQTLYKKLKRVILAEELDEPGEAVEATPLNEVRIEDNDAKKPAGITSEAGAVDPLMGTSQNTDKDDINCHQRRCTRTQNWNNDDVIVRQSTEPTDVILRQSTEPTDVILRRSTEPTDVIVRRSTEPTDVTIRQSTEPIDVISHEATIN